MASGEKTRSYFNKFPAVLSRDFGTTGWKTSALGFGSYRIARGVAEHEAALREALLHGINLIDTSTNYGDGLSEECVGEIIAKLISQGKIEREEIIVVTKTGYVQGRNLEEAQKRKSQGRPYSEMVEYQPSCWHCISPEFLADQITASLKRLKMEKVEVVLLHNPEYYLKAHGDHAEYYQRIQKAFIHLELEIARGRIQAYGISSNTFPDPKESPEFTSLEVILDIADKVGSGFRVIQFPLNLVEGGAALEPNQLHGTLLELAAEHELATLANRPLNAFAGNRLLRLADFPAHEGIDRVGNVQRIFGAITQLEADYPARHIVPFQAIAWGHILQQNFKKISEVDAWNGVLQHQIRPSLARELPKISAAGFSEWATVYQDASSKLFSAISILLDGEAALAAQAVSKRLDDFSLPLASSSTLSQKVIRVYQSLPGLTCTLLGMRKPAYVTDALHAKGMISPELALKVIAQDWSS